MTVHIMQVVYPVNTVAIYSLLKKKYPPIRIADYGHELLFVAHELIAIFNIIISLSPLTIFCYQGHRNNLVQNTSGMHMWMASSVLSAHYKGGQVAR
jgi:hypothetical protein